MLSDDDKSIRTHIGSHKAILQRGDKSGITMLSTYITMSCAQNIYLL